MNIQHKTDIDWFRFRTQAQPLEALEALKPIFGVCGQVTKLKPLERGILGFQQAAQIMVGAVPVGRMDYGGESQRGWVRVDVTGEGCSWVQDWDALDKLEALPGAEVKRLDVALTTWRGEVGHDAVVSAHAAGRFSPPGAGRSPNMQTIINTDLQAGRTCYIGSRANSDKFMRCYEKGFEIAAKHPGLTHVSGFPVEDIYRCEVEFKGKGSHVPFDAISRRDEFFAGAYPFCADLLPDVESDVFLKRAQRAPNLELSAVLANIRTQYGNSLFTALHAYHGDVFAVWDKVIGKDHNQRLVEAGVLMVDHD